MSLPLIGSTPENPEDWEGWGQNHFINHQGLADNLLTVKNVQGLLFPIARVDLKSDALDLWLYQHATMHDQINRVLGTQGFNLLDLDPEDPDQLEQWILQNSDEHIRFCTALGVN